jgi:peptide deformylase
VPGRAALRRAAICRDNTAMAIQTLLKMGDPRLMRVAQRVTHFDTDALHLLISDMLDTMAAANGAGLAAPQIAVDLQVVIFGTGAVNPRYPDAPLVPRTVLVNPVITPLDDAGNALDMLAYDRLKAAPLTSLPGAMEDGWEGCLSVPGFRGAVQRFKRIRYQGFDQYGDPIDRVAEGFHARVVQHECDHLLGILYPMRVHDFARFGFTEVLFPELADGAGDDD